MVSHFAISAFFHAYLKIICNELTTPTDLIFTHTYLGTPQSSLTLNFSRSAAPIVAQYYQLLRLGHSGFRRVMLQLARIAHVLASSHKEWGFVIFSNGGEAPGLPLVAFCIDPARRWGFDEFTFVEELRRKGGWIVPAYEMENERVKMKLMRVVIREEFESEMCASFTMDVTRVLEHLLESRAGDFGSSRRES